jgi:hypothetical protein
VRGADELTERRLYNIFVIGEPDLPGLRETAGLREILAAGWRIERFEVAPLADGHTVTVWLRRPCMAA